MIKLKKLNEVPTKRKNEHAVALSIELAMTLASFGLLIYNMVIGDPDNRNLACLGSALCFMLPFLLEIILKVRFSFIAHMLADIYMIFTVFAGSALNLFKTVGPYDEIGHFLFGYFCCLFFFYVFLAWKGSRKLTIGQSVFAIFMLSMAIAPLWEITEFCADIFLAQDSMGYASPEFIEEAQALGYTGIEYSIYKLKYEISVWDTITDMLLHFAGSILFIIQYLIEKHFDKKKLMFAWLEDDYFNNKKDFYIIEDDEEYAKPQEPKVTEI